MGLGERLKLSHDVPAEPIARRDDAPQIQSQFELRARLHRQLIDELDLGALDKLPPDRLREEVQRVVPRLVATLGLSLGQAEQARLAADLLDELVGFGPLEPILRDMEVSDILVNGHATVFVERHGKLELSAARFRDDAHLTQIISRIVSRVGRRVDESSPMVDARLPDGSRVNAIIPPLAIDGPSLSIRRFGARPLRIRDLLAHESASKEALAFLAGAVRARTNILISGGTGSGKTTMLNALSAFIPAGERVVTIEDSAELRLQQRHVVRLETRPPNLEGHGEVTARDLVRNTLRMRPDRIVIGEVRAGEILDMLQAMNTGHEGSMTTLHANTPRDALTRIETMIGMSGVPLSETATRMTIARAIQVVVQLSRGVDGRRRMTSVCEIVGLEGETVTMNELFRFEQRGVDKNGGAVGGYVSSGLRPKTMDRIERAGIDLARILDPFLEG